MNKASGPNNALHSDAPRPAGSGFPRSLRSLGAGERGRWAALMKFALALSIAVLAACSARGRPFSTDLLVAPETTSTIFVYRLDQFVGGGYTAKVMLNGEVMGHLKNAGFISASVQPGRHVVEVDKMFWETGGRYPTELNTEPGQLYFVRYDQRAVVKATGIQAVPVVAPVYDGFTVVPREQALAELRSLKESK